MTNGGNGTSVTVQLSGHSVDARDVKAWEYIIWLLMVRLRIRGFQTVFLSKVASGSSAQKGIRVMSSTGDQIRFRVQPRDNGTAWEFNWKIPPWVKNPDKFRKELTRASKEVSKELSRKRPRVRPAKSQSPTNEPTTAPLPASGDEQKTKPEKGTRMEAKQKTRHKKGEMDVAVALLHDLFGDRDFYIHEITRKIAEDIGVNHKCLINHIGRLGKLGILLTRVDEMTADGKALKKKGFPYRWVVATKESSPRQPQPHDCRTNLTAMTDDEQASMSAPQLVLLSSLTPVEQCRLKLAQIADKKQIGEARRQETEARLLRVNEELKKNEVELDTLAEEDTRVREELEQAELDDARAKYDALIASLPPSVRNRSDLIHQFTAPRPKPDGENLPIWVPQSPNGETPPEE